jgi:26S proteasome regulatory subunit N2
MDAGGRNCAVALQSSRGFLKHSACAGLALWAQSWYWYPMFHFFSLALTPTVLIGLNSNFDMPTDFSVICSGSSDLFAHPPLTTEKQETKKERVATAILSTTLKHKVREKAKDKQKVPSSASEPDITSILLSNANLTSPREPLDPACAEVTVGSSFRLPNPSRLTQIQMQSCKFDLEQRFIPVATIIKTSGIIMLADQEPGTMPQITKFHDFAQAINESASPTAFEWPCGLL